MSVLFDGGARRLLERAYAKPGQWVGTRLVFPSAREAAYFGARGINVLGRDQWGRDRWAAGFIRAVFYQHRWHYARGSFQAERRTAANDTRSLQYELGRRVPVLGILPAGRAVRIRTKPGGAAAMKAVKRLPDARRIYDDRGEPAGRWADPTARDWLRPQQPSRAARPVELLVLVGDGFALLIYGEPAFMPQVDRVVDAGKVLLVAGGRAVFRSPHHIDPEGVVSVALGHRRFLLRSVLWLRWGLGAEVPTVRGFEGSVRWSFAPLTVRALPGSLECPPRVCQRSLNRARDMPYAFGGYSGIVESAVIPWLTLAGPVEGFNPPGPVALNLNPSLKVGGRPTRTSPRQGTHTPRRSAPPG